MEFDAAITSVSEQSWRSIPHLDPALRESISDAYRPYCTILNCIVHVPRSGPQSVVLDKLRDVDCIPIHPLNGFPAAGGAP